MKFGTAFNLMRSETSNVFHLIKSTFHESVFTFNNYNLHNNSNIGKEINCYLHPKLALHLKTSRYTLATERSYLSVLFVKKYNIWPSVLPRNGYQLKYPHISGKQTCYPRRASQHKNKFSSKQRHVLPQRTNTVINK